jgi:hypothetical protein
MRRLEIIENDKKSQLKIQEDLNSISQRSV